MSTTVGSKNALPSYSVWHLDEAVELVWKLLELEPGHDLEFAVGDADDPFASTLPLPVGGQPRLSFPTPVDQLRLRGIPTLPINSPRGT